MYFKQVLDERCGCASHVIARRATHEAAIVDPALTIDVYEPLLRERDFNLSYVIDTHIHADHVSGARRLVAAHGAELCLHESATVTYPFRAIEDGEEFPLGTLPPRAIHTPGHRPELMSILIVNPARSPEPSMVLTGDSSSSAMLAGRISAGVTPRPCTTVSGGCHGGRIWWRSFLGASRGRAGSNCAAAPARPSGSSGSTTR